MKNKEKLSLLAESITLCEESQNENDVFLTVDMRVCTSEVNANNEGVSKEFIADVVARNEELAALPLYADVAALKAKKYDKLTHMYNRFNGKFSSTQIGGLLNFRSEDEDGLVSLYATARIPKRETEICESITELYNMGALCFSFEVKYRSEDTHDMNGALIIDAAEHNSITGVAVVTNPAFASSVALDLVAEADESIDADSEMTAERGETVMPNEELRAEVEEQVEQPVIAEEEASEEEVVQAEEQQEDEERAEAAKRKGCAEDEQEAPEDTEEENDDGEQANAEDASAEVVFERVTTTQEYRAGDPKWGEPDTICTTVEQTVVETVDGSEAVVAEDESKDDDIASLKSRIAELEVIAEKYNALVAEAEARELKLKQEKAKAFAEKQGLDITNTAVAEAIEKVDYEAIANLSMENNETQDVAVAEKETVISLASFVDLETKEDGKFGNMLKRRSN